MRKRFKRLDPMTEAHLLAHEIEWIHARALAIESRRYKTRPEEFFDPLTATELGNLIYNRMVPQK